MGIWSLRLHRGGASAAAERRPTLVDRRIERLDEELVRLREDHARLETEVTAAVEGERQAAARAAAPPPFVLAEMEEDHELDTAGRERARRERLLRTEWDTPQPEDEGGRWPVMSPKGLAPAPALEHERRRARMRALTVTLLALAAAALLLWVWRDFWWPGAGGRE